MFKSAILRDLVHLKLGKALNLLYYYIEHQTASRGIKSHFSTTKKVNL